jgi:hypothetical protein
VAGGTVAFSVGVAGAGPFIYHWQFNGTNLPGISATVAGGSVNDGGPATNADLLNACGVAVDAAGNLLIAEQIN